MDSCFLYHAWGQYDHKCSGIEYKGNTIILHIETETLKKTCPQCYSRLYALQACRITRNVGWTKNYPKIGDSKKSKDLIGWKATRFKVLIREHMTNKLFFELTRVSIGMQERLSHTPTEKEWKDMYAMAEKQALIGACFAGLQMLQKKGYDIPKDLYLK